MKKIQIQDLKPGLINGVEVQMPCSAEIYREGYFEWTAVPLICKFSSNEVSGGILKAWHYLPVFTEVETHIENEMFYFVSGTALMLFADIAEGKTVLDSIQVVRIQAGTQIIIQAGKGHFVAVAEGDEPAGMVVVSPKVGAPRITLPEAVRGI